MKKRTFSSLVLAFLVVISVLTNNLAAEVPGPFGILQLPNEYESHRSTYRTEISQTQETVLADVEGEGCLRHFWLTIGGVTYRPDNALRLTLRIYFDGKDTPNVELPVGPFFGIHHGHKAKMINSPYIQVTDRSGFNSYFPMPFANGMRITLQREDKYGTSVWFQADYHKYKPGSLTEKRRFATAYRRVNRCEHYGKPYHLGHGSGKGVIVGMTLGMRVFDGADAWYHCGGDLMLLDGRTDRARLLSGIGGEDFFGTAWGQDVFSNRSIGTPYYDVLAEPGDKPKIEFAAYRFFDRDPIAFADSFWYDFGTLANDVASVLYWYQEGEVMPVAKLASLEDRRPGVLVPDGKYDIPLKGEREWLVCGPFSCVSKEEFDRKEFPEEGIDLSQTAPADFGQYAEAVKKKLGPPTVTKWKKGVKSVFNFVDMTPHFRPRLRTNGGFPVDGSAYAVTDIDSKTAGKVKLRLGHDDWFKLWVNGELVYEGPEQNGFKTTEIEVSLKKGKNQFLAKVANRANTNFRAWVFLFDVLP